MTKRCDNCSNWCPITPSDEIALCEALTINDEYSLNTDFDKYPHQSLINTPKDFCCKYYRVKEFE